MESNESKPKSTPGGSTNPAEHSRVAIQSGLFSPGMTASPEPEIPVPTNPPQPGSLEKPESKSHEAKRREWFLVNFVEPIQDNFRRDLTEGQIEFWMREVTLAGMTKAEIVTTVEYIKRDCQYFPTLFDLHRLRPKRVEKLYLPPKTTEIPGEVKKLAEALDICKTNLSGEGGKKRSKTSAYVQRMKEIGKFQRFRPEGVTNAINYDSKAIRGTE